MLREHQLSYNTSLLDDKKYSSLALEDLSGVIGERVRPSVDGDVEKVGDLSLEAMEDEQVAIVDGVFEGAFGALGDESGTPEWTSMVKWWLMISEEDNELVVKNGRQFTGRKLFRSGDRLKYAYTSRDSDSVQIVYEVEFFEGWKPLSPIQLAVEEKKGERETNIELAASESFKDVHRLDTDGAKHLSGSMSIFYGYSVYRWSMTNLGSEVYTQADVPDTWHIFVDIGLGFHVELTWSKAQIEEYTRLIAQIKAQIKMVAQGIRELLQLLEE
ncbi:protein UXT [Tanacetum coccineum]